jgi:hypothetical protein
MLTVSFRFKLRKQVGVVPLTKIGGVSSCRQCRSIYWLEDKARSELERGGMVVLASLCNSSLTMNSDRFRVVVWHG